MKNDEIISRVFTTTRKYTDKQGVEQEFTLIYPFKTYSVIWDELPRENPLLAKLYLYFQQLIMEGVPEKAGRKSVSTGKKLLIDVEKRKSDLTGLAFDADYQRQQNNQHKLVELHFMKNDPYTIATEIPVYNDEWMGHIDILRVIDGGKRLQLPDFKPNAHKETKAASQVYRYKKLLCEILDISPDLIEAGYFDENNAYFITL
jgi:hypothetical protein